MARTNFIFKNTTYRKGLGGEMPPNTHIKGSKGYYYLGETDDTNLQNLQKWEPMPVSDQVARGFGIMYATDRPKYPDDPDNEETRPLTTEEQENQHAALKAMKKIELKAKIQGQVGDIGDLVADLSKRMGLLERVTLRTLEFLYNSSSISSEIPQAYKDGYSSLLTQYVSDIDSGNYRDRVDIEDNAQLYTRLQERYNTITDLVEEYINY